MHTFAYSRNDDCRLSVSMQIWSIFMQWILLLSVTLNTFLLTLSLVICYLLIVSCNQPWWHFATDEKKQRLCNLQYFRQYALKLNEEHHWTYIYDFCTLSHVLYIFTNISCVLTTKFNWIYIAVKHMLPILEILCWLNLNST